MLESLHISNYALIDRVDIDFHRGLNIITGETGAGKSIMLGALSLILGGRADFRSVTNRERKSVIEAQFAISDYPALRRYCEENDIEWDEGHCLLRREINAATGRSRAFVNDSPVALSKLSGVAELLVDIHSQHQNQLLARPEFQLRVIDSLAGNASRLKEHAKRYSAFRESVRRMKHAQAALARVRDDEEYLRYQLEQLNELGLSEGEQQELERERDLLSNLSAVKSSLRSAIEALDADDGGAIDGVRTAADAVDEISDVIDADEQLPDRLNAAAIELDDIADTLRRIYSNLNADPARLEQIEERLNAIYNLEHKHRVGSVEELIQLQRQLEEKLMAIDNSDDTLRALAKEARRLQSLAKESAAQLSETRREAAAKFADELTRVATPLGMKNLTVDIRVQPADLSLTGADRVDFLFAFNKNQQPLSVADGASGGEISRLMLSIKSIVASKMDMPSIIFDEIDTGVSGDVANRMGEMMLAIADSLQVIAITHLPTVAAKGEHHYKVYKEDTATATHTHIRALTPDERVDELALMLSGNASDESARANARSLLNPKK